MDLLPKILEESDSICTERDLDPKTFKKNYFNKRKPVLLKGHAKTWPAFKKWNLDFFDGLDLNEEVELEIGNVMQKTSQFENFGFNDYIKNLKQGQLDTDSDRTYLSMFEVFELFPDLKDDVDFSYLTKYTWADIPAAWIGPEGTVTGFHTDNYNNMLAQIAGKKLVLLASPKFNSSMYPSTKFDLGSVLSEVDINAFDQDKFPNFLNVKFLKVELEEGDVLYNPKNWWHYVKSLSTSISVNNFGYTLSDIIFLQPLESIKISLHYRGFYKTKDCTCHKYVDGKWVAK